MLIDRVGQSCAEDGWPAPSAATKRVVKTPKRSVLDMNVILCR
jgi:hypothetical protein